MTLAEGTRLSMRPLIPRGLQDAGSAQGFAFAGLVEEFEQEILRRQRAIAPARPHIGDGGVVAPQGGLALANRLEGPGPADHRRLAFPGAFGDSRHAAEADADVGDPALRELQVEGAEAGGDVLVEALGDLVAGEAPRRIGAGQTDALDELAGPAVLLAVIEEEILQRDLAPLAAPAQHQAGTESDQRRRAVADRGAIGDVAAHGPAITDL